MVAWFLAAYVARCCAYPIDNYEQDYNDRVTRLIIYFASGGKEFAKETVDDRRELAQASNRLAVEKRLAGKAGILLKSSQMRATAPPNAKNAADIYRDLMRMFKKRPLVAADKDLFASRGPLPSDKGKLAQIRTLVGSRQAELTLFKLAAERKYCFFSRDWSRGMEVLLPEYATMRDGMRLLRLESLLMALDGQRHRAIDNLATGFAAARHAASERIIVGYLVGVAIDGITLSTLSEILIQCGPDRSLASKGISLIRTKAPSFSTAANLAGEGVGSAAYFNQLRRAQIFEQLAILTTERPDNYPEEKSWIGRPLPPANRRIHNESVFVRQLLDAGQAQQLFELRQLLTAASRPDRQRPIAMKSVLDEPPSRTLGGHLARSFGLASGSFENTESRIKAKCDVVLAGAEALAFRANHGTWSKSVHELAAFAGSLPLDPFTGKPLQYRLENNGFVIYSCGEHGNFDGGKPGVEVPGKQACFRYP